MIAKGQLVLFGAILIVAGASAQSFTVGAHSDPSPSGAAPVFNITDFTVSGSWLQPGLTLSIQAPGAVATYNNVNFQFGPVSRSGNNLGAGSALYYTNDINNPLFSITWLSGFIVEPFFAGASFFTASGVNFGGSAIAALNPAGWSNQQFTYSFANPGGIGGPERTYTASMTSSAVPEPATMTVLALAALAAARRRRA
jgi:MYXO-CTERM domain-containing protein